VEGGVIGARPGNRGVWALGALGLILAVTAAWWAFALWPLSPEAPAWVARARATCFGVTAGGMPGTGGWLLLIGEPVGMLALLLTVWGDAVLEGLRGLGRSGTGRVALALGLLLVAWGGQLAWGRVGELRGEPFPADAALVERVDQAPPPLRLVDQRGDTVTLDRFRGRPVLLTFAYGHCRSVCPATVHRMLLAQRQLPDRVSLLVVTLDPWRDTPERLSHIAEGWGLGERARMLGGSVESVKSVLEAWRVPEGRDPHSGDIAHAPTIYAIGADGRLAFRATGVSGPELVALIRRL
jgi:protein SCO1/2